VALFGTVVRDQLPETEFLLLFRIADDLTVPGPTPDFERRERWERVTGRLIELGS
jgi:hypothetical protein